MNLKPRDIICLNCEATGLITDWEFCENYVCAHCGQIHRVVGVSVSENGDIKNKDVSKHEIFITLGTVFTWHDEKYKICGYSVKADEHGYKWHEYVGITDKGAYIHISQYNGHWNVIELLDDAMHERIKGTDIPERKFDLWNKYKARTLYAEGSFPYDVKRWSKYSVVENVSPPYILIGEKANETISYLGVYISPRQLRKKLDKDIILPYREGVGANQAFPAVLNPTQWWIGSVAVIVLLLILNGIFSSAAAEKTIYKQEIVVSDSTHNKPFTTESFELTPTLSVLKFMSISNISNNWVELGIELVNEENNQSRSFVMGMEYYSGVDEGYAWSEGNQSHDESLCSVSAGVYHLVITPIKSDTSKPVKVNVTVVDDPPYNINMLILAGMMLVFTIVITIIKYFWNQSRWKSSPYSPYNDEE